ncbi:hypothetical protein AVEN_10233-1 [Araneus ventricosus]|uniref:Uncharacterized protein n=1 Tax=Araneus ventricosus TaxID=182803 RepID=A0A4Y2J7E8_ARAVE|nr:hypothetical protein AVEN_10233-1 [Araneus ventricosus]
MPPKLTFHYHTCIEVERLEYSKPDRNQIATQSRKLYCHLRLSRNAREEAPCMCNLEMHRVHMQLHPTLSMGELLNENRSFLVASEKMIKAGWIRRPCHPRRECVLLI